MNKSNRTIEKAIRGATRRALAMAATASALAITGVNSSSAESSEPLLCGLRSTIVAGLQREYAENPAAMGVTNAGTVMELYTTTDGGTWTLIVTLGDGTSCVVAAGGEWSDVKPSTSGILS